MLRSKLLNSFFSVILLTSPIISLANDFESDQEKASYAIGTKYGESLHKDLADISLKHFIEGLQDAFHDHKKKLSDMEISQALTAFQQQKVAQMQKQRSKLATQNAEEGKQFLEQNLKKEGVKVTNSGLQYKILKAGSGKSPSSNDVVEVHYEGTLIDGTIFDSSRQRGETIQFPVNGVIKGWTEALQLMQEGSHWILYIPSELGYGESGTHGPIGPNATLIFDVELISIKQP